MLSSHSTTRKQREAKRKPPFAYGHLIWTLGIGGFIIGAILFFGHLEKETKKPEMIAQVTTVVSREGISFQGRTNHDHVATYV